MDTVLYSPTLLQLSRKSWGSIRSRDSPNDRTREFYRPCSYFREFCGACLRVQVRLWGVSDTFLDFHYQLYGTNDSQSEVVGISNVTDPNEVWVIGVHGG